MTITDRARYVALGSSFAAGPGIPSLVHRVALRSSRNYPHLLASALSLQLTDLTCSGATTSHLLAEPQHTPTVTLPPQIDGVTPDTALVTVTAGGNDLGYLGMLTAAALRGSAVRRLGFLPDAVLDRLAGVVEVPGPERFAEVRASLTAVVEAVRRRAPDARVVLVDYLTVLGTDATPSVTGLTAAQIEQGRAIATGLAEATAGAATTTAGAELLAVSEPNAGHGVGAPEPWITGVELGLPWTGGALPFHPTLAGMVAVAERLVALLAAP